MFANIIFQYFTRGGPVMWPILACALAAVAVVGERAFWWWRESLKRDLQKREEILGALENSDIDAAKKIARGSGDPVVRMIHRSLNHAHSSIPVALQMAAGIELERAGLAQPRVALERAREHDVGHVRSVGVERP